MRGKETDRRPGEILSEIRALVDEGVQEITLLGQKRQFLWSSIRRSWRFC
ncbi:tRNA-i(6)A37 methylthiotransferase [Cutibacterium acnes JCM 18909]|nr:tRNA-i(6)A37 methylthiotransferase [Cutibacterium acnes JCM 18909]